MKQFLHVFLTEFRKTLFVFAFQKHFFKKFNLFLFFSLLQINFFCIFRSFLCADIKNNFKKIKKIILMHFQVKNTFEKQLQPNILYIFFTVYKPQPQFLPNAYLNSTNYT